MSVDFRGETSDADDWLKFDFIWRQKVPLCRRSPSRLDTAEERVGAWSCSKQFSDIKA